MAPTGVVHSGLSSRVYEQYDEILQGLDGVSSTFTLARRPIDGTVRMYRNGLRLARGIDYTVSGRSVETQFVPEPDEVLLVDYSWR